jgi:dienelactone hydrolase
MQFVANFRRLLPPTIAACFLFISGCASHPPPRKHDAIAPQQVVNPGYQPQLKYVTTSLHDSWQQGDTALDVTLVTPSASGPFPLIVYLPGLGESASAGLLWRTHWAEAGYAVLAVQANSLAESVWASTEARSGDFQDLGREYFAQPALEARLKTVDYAIGGAQRRANSGMANYAALDMTRVAIIGFDLGAQTAAVIAGEKPAFPYARPADWNVQAAVILSPYATLAAGGLEQRYGSISMPVLSITGTEDADPLGVVTLPSLRRAPWQSMPPGDKYLLLLQGGTHGLLAGSGMIDKSNPIVTSFRGKKGRKQNGGGNQGASPDGDMQFGGSGSGRHRGGNSSDNSNARDGGAGSAPRTFDMRHIAAVQSVSTAFLDATVKNDAIAREWLLRNATQWLGDSAVLQSK